MSTWGSLVSTLVLAIAAYSAAATLVARGSARRHLPKVAAVTSAIALAMILAPIYLDPAFKWSTETSTLVRDVVGWAVAACIVVLPPLAVTTRLAMHLAVTATPPARRWVMTWAAGIGVLLPSLFLAFAAAIMITGDGP